MTFRVGVVAGATISAILVLLATADWEYLH